MSALPLLAFGVFVGFVGWHIAALYNEIEDKEELLMNRRRRRWLRDELDMRFFREYKHLSETGDLESTDRLDEKLKTFLHAEEELRGLWPLVGSGAGVVANIPPATIVSEPQRRTWHRVQTRCAGIKRIVDEHLRD